ncbi:MAG: molybdopterin-dependent oxidoreductase [Acidimicrobiia bacterium]
MDRKIVNQSRPAVLRPSQVRRPTRAFRQEGLPRGLTEASWRLTVRALGQEWTLSLGDLRAEVADVAQEGLFVCVCRWAQVNSFGGVLLKDIVTMLGLDEQVDGLVVRQRSMPGADGRSYETSVPYRTLVADDALIALEMDGQPLTLETGWPARLISLSLFGYKQVKCLGSLDFVEELEPGWWELKRGYDVEGTIQPGTVSLLGHTVDRLEVRTSGRVELPLRDL